MTEFTHFTLLADGHVVEPNADFGTQPGPCIMSMKVWAQDAEQAADMIVDIGKQLGFHADGELQMFITDPEEPAEEHPFGYDIQFTAYPEMDEEEGGAPDSPTLH